MFLCVEMPVFPDNLERKWGRDSSQKVIFWLLEKRENWKIFLIGGEFSTVGLYAADLSLERATHLLAKKLIQAKL